MQMQVLHLLVIVVLNNSKMSDYGFSEKRKKKKDKSKERKKHPYKKGGKHRTGNISKKK